MTVLEPQSTTLTSGDFLTETAAWEPFDRMVTLTGAFNIYREIDGEYLQPRCGTEDKRARIDRLLVPNRKAVDAGWTNGIIGVEGKKSGFKIGKLVSQAIDYTRCVFRLKEPIPEVLIMPVWVFIYPSDRIYGDLESVMAQNRVGTINIGQYGLAFQCSAIHALEIGLNGGMAGKSVMNIGNKRGSR